MDKWDYIKLISNASDKYGYLIIEMLNKYGAQNTREITEEQAKEFYETVVKRNARKN